MSESIDDLTQAIHQGDALEVLGDVPEASVHAVVTDPPYGLAFLGRDWDDVPDGDEATRLSMFDQNEDEE